MLVTKRNGREEPFDIGKVLAAVSKACRDCGAAVDPALIGRLQDAFDSVHDDKIAIDDIQEKIEDTLMDMKMFDVARSYVIYRERHKNARFVRERMDYIDRYGRSPENAATSSETDPNANITMKNVSTLEGEVYKTTNRIIQRQRMKDKLKEMFPEVAGRYADDIEGHAIYVHDEATSPVLKYYCQAVSLYPLMAHGVGNMDGVTPSPPNDLQSFSGQVTNLIFLLSSQCKGAVAVGEYFVAFNYYAVQEYGEDYYLRLDETVTSPSCRKQRTIRDAIHKAFKQFVFGINQPAGNRNYQSPFVNVNYFDHVYFDALFGDFCYPDGTKPRWEAVSCLQKLFMRFFNKLRETQVLTFPVESMAMVYDPVSKKLLDGEYRDWTAQMYSEGHSFFTYISDSADSLSSCCRLKNEISENTFNPSTGLTGVMTGSCNVITLNLNHIVQDWAKTQWVFPQGLKPVACFGKKYHDSLKRYIADILGRVYKYQIAYKTMLYDLEDAGMFAASNGGYIKMSKLYCTIGLNGFNEAARFLGLEVGNNEDYIAFMQLVLGTVKEQNKLHSIHDRKRPFVFNGEAVPAESLGHRNYEWDKAAGYWVPGDVNLYNSYFYDAHDDTSVLDKFVLHGGRLSRYCDGGNGAHINLADHLTKEQYLKLLDFAAEQGTNYFTFNIPNSKCDGCGYITKHPITECPKCHSRDITQYTRIIG